MSEQLTQVLRRMLTMREADAILKGRIPSPWLFVGGNGDPILPGSFWQNVWKPLLKHAGLRYRKPHTLRHTYSSRCGPAGRCDGTQPLRNQSLGEGRRR